MTNSSRTLVAAALIAATLPAAATASPVAVAPRLDVRVADGAVRIAGASSTRRGATTLDVRRAGGEPRTIAVVELRPGRTRQDVEALELDGILDGEPIEAVGRLVAGTTVAGGERVSLTVTTRARRYVVVDLSNGDSRAAQWRPADGRRTGVRPVADARLELRDDGLRLPATLPTRGNLRIRNAGERLHHALAIRLRKGVSRAEARRWLAAGRTPRAIGREVSLTGLLSAGVTAWSSRPLRPGRYAVASYYVQADGRSDLERGLIAFTKVV